MAEGTGGGAAGNGSGSNRDASRPRPRVQQLRPTNKDAVAPASPAPTVPAAVRPAESGAAESDKSSSTTKAPAPVQPRVIIPRIVTGPGSGSTILVNSCQVRDEKKRSRDDGKAESKLHLPAGQSDPPAYQEHWMGVWGHCSRLSSRLCQLRPVPQVSRNAVHRDMVHEY